MVTCITTVAQRLEKNDEVVTETIALVNYQSIQKSELKTLPNPINATRTAPTLTMHMQPTNAPSVAVFDKEIAKALFPVPKSSESTDVANVVTSVDSIDSAIVALEV